MGIEREKLRESQDAIPYQEYLLRVLFASFQPAVKLGLQLNYPLDTIKEMMTLALWKEAKAKHNTINLISLIFGKSTRTLKTLSARYNRGRFFQQSEMNLCRQVEDLKTMKEFGNISALAAAGSKPCMTFMGEGFDTQPVRYHRAF